MSTEKTQDNKFDTIDDITLPEYIKNGEPLTGYVQDSEVGQINRPQYQIFQHILLLKRELNLIKKFLNELPTLEENEIQEDTRFEDVSNQIQNIIKVTSQKLSELEKSVRENNNEIQILKQFKPTNFLDFIAVKQISKTVELLDKKVAQLELAAAEDVQNQNPSIIDINELKPLVQRLDQLETSFRNLYSEFGTYQTESNQGTGIKNRIQVISENVQNLKKSFENSLLTLSQDQLLLVSDTLDIKLVPYKIKNDQSHSIQLEINQRVSDQEKKLQAALEKYHISDEVLEQTTLEEYLNQIKENTNEQLNKSNELELQIGNLKDFDKKQESQLEVIKTKLAEIQYLLGEPQQIEQNLSQIVESLVFAIGTYEEENQIVGQLSKIENLKYEFSENIQRINMLIGDNTPGQETGIYRQLLESRQAKTKYYKMTLSKEQLEKVSSGKKLVINVPEYINTKGNQFIVRTLLDHKNLVVQYDDYTKKLYIHSLGEFNPPEFKDTEIILLPINIEMMQIDATSIYIEEAQ